jgi:hypothetical protein
VCTVAARLGISCGKVSRSFLVSLFLNKSWCWLDQSGIASAEYEEGTVLLDRCCGGIRSTVNVLVFHSYLPGPIPAVISSVGHRYMKACVGVVLFVYAPLAELALEGLACVEPYPGAGNTARSF